MHYGAETIWQTDDRLVEPIAATSHHSGYTVIRSDIYPKYYGANGLILKDPLSANLSAWESIFKSHFEESKFGHRFFLVRDPHCFETIRTQAHALDYDEVKTTVGLMIENTQRLVPWNGHYDIRKVETEPAWQSLADFDEASSKDEPWYTEEIFQELFAKTRHVSEAIGIEWFCLHDPDSTKIIAKAGVFTHNGIGRLQEVATAITHRRKGLASTLVSYIARYAFTELAVGGVAICADQDYVALDLYRKLGAKDIGLELALMKYESHLRQPKSSETAVN